MNFYISDTHFGRSAVIAPDERPFDSVDEMDAIMIENWNKKVTDNDTVFILGDFCNGDAEEVSSYLDKLNGTKVLITGNHDEGALETLSVKQRFSKISDVLRVQDSRTSLVLCHFPMLVWKGETDTSMHLYGHIHSSFDPMLSIMMQRDGAYNTSVCINRYEPCTLGEIILNNALYKRKYYLN